jgi:hypothetical protein
VSGMHATFLELTYRVMTIWWFSSDRYLWSQNDSRDTWNIKGIHSWRFDTCCKTLDGHQLRNAASTEKNSFRCTYRRYITEGSRGMDKYRHQNIILDLLHMWCMDAANHIFKIDPRPTDVFKQYCSNVQIDLQGGDHIRKSTD